MEENRALYNWINGGLKASLVSAALVPFLALGILMGGDVLSKKTVDDLNTTMDTAVESIMSGSSIKTVPNSVKGTGKKDSTQAILNDYKAYLESQS